MPTQDSFIRELSMEMTKVAHDELVPDIEVLADALVGEYS